MDFVTRISFAAGMFFCALCGQAAADDDAERKLASVAVFSPGINGFVARQSDGDKNYRSILSGSRAQAAFIALIQNSRATPEAKLYAACGLHKLRFANTDELFTPDKTEQVTVLRGDVLRKENFYLLYHSIKQFGCE